MKKNLFVLVLVASALTLNAQHYVFSETSATYEELIDDTPVANPDFDNDQLTNLPLDNETFHLFGLDFTFGGFTTYAIQTFGNLRIDNDSSAVIIDGIFTNLDSIDETTSVSWKIDGTSGELIVKAQWKNVKLALGEATNFANFQIWIYQETGVIEIHYGEQSENNATGYTDDNGPYAGIFYSPDTFDEMYEKLWLYGEPTNIQQDATSIFYFGRLLGVPSNGTVYRFSPTTTTDIHEKSSDRGDIQVYPNPTSNALFLAGQWRNFDKVRIFDSLGKLHLEQKIATQKLDVSSLGSGTYILEFNQGTGVFHRSFIKEG